MKYLSILFVAAMTIVACTSTEEAAEVNVCDCVAAKAEADKKDPKAYAADEANAACMEAMKDEKAVAACSKDKKEEAKKEEPKKEMKKEEPKKEEPKKEEPAGNQPE